MIWYIIVIISLLLIVGSSIYIFNLRKKKVAYIKEYLPSCKDCAIKCMDVFPYMCIAVDHSVKSEIALKWFKKHHFNREAYFMFIKDNYPDLIPYLRKRGAVWIKPSSKYRKKVKESKIKFLEHIFDNLS